MIIIIPNTAQKQPCLNQWNMKAKVKKTNYRMIAPLKSIKSIARHSQCLSLRAQFV